jgi:hypothetical protein
MKRLVEALVMMEMVAVIAAMAIAGLCGVGRAEPVQQLGAHVISPVVKLKGSASLATRHGSSVTPARFHVETTFSTDTPGAPLFTIQQAVIFFPDHAGTNGRLFPSCSARQIEHFHNDLGRCPKGSKIGSGTVRGQALQLHFTANGRVSMFNSQHGKSITINIQTTHPASISTSFEARLTQLHGTYGEKLTLRVPHSLQELIPGLFVGVQDFNVTIGGSVRVHGVQYSFLKARTCPKTALHGEFGFKDWTTGQIASATVDAKVHCTSG